MDGKDAAFMYMEHSDEGLPEKQKEKLMKYNKEDVKAVDFALKKIYWIAVLKIQKPRNPISKKLPRSVFNNLYEYKK